MLACGPTETGPALGDMLPASKRSRGGRQGMEVIIEKPESVTNTCRGVSAPTAPRLVSAIGDVGEASSSRSWLGYQAMVWTETPESGELAQLDDSGNG